MVDRNDPILNSQIDVRSQLGLSTVSKLDHPFYSYNLPLGLYYVYAKIAKDFQNLRDIHYGHCENGVVWSSWHDLILEIRRCPVSGELRFGVPTESKLPYFSPGDWNGAYFQNGDFCLKIEHCQG